MLSVSCMTDAVSVAPSLQTASHLVPTIDRPVAAVITTGKLDRATIVSFHEIDSAQVIDMVAITTTIATTGMKRDNRFLISSACLSKHSPMSLAEFLGSSNHDFGCRKTPLHRFQTKSVCPSLTNVFHKVPF
ncbi:uncharacterized protein LY79DRAFT_566910, partial [Colletotrichum navitas]